MCHDSVYLVNTNTKYVITVYRPYTMLDSRLNALVLANIDQQIIDTIEMDIFTNKNLYL